MNANSTCSKKAQDITERVYIPIVEEFKREGLDYEFIGKKITEISRHEEGDIARNALMLLIGLLHKDEPIDAPGIDLWEQEPSDIRQNMVDMMVLVTDDLIL